ncbi:MAG: maltokinase N-terminal cap-like domain-containing protein [Chloroflexota bacterium]
MHGPDPALAPLRAAIERDLPAALARDLPGQRWFGDKDRPISGVTLVALGLEAHARQAVGWALAEVAFDSGPPARYALPLAAAPGDHPGALLPMPELGLSLLDGASDPAFADWWLGRLAGGRELALGHAALAFAPEPGLSAVLERALGAGGRPLGAEQSNSAIRYDDAALVKCFRRLAAGVNPDIEIGLRLWNDSTFRHIPEPLGSVSLRGEGEETAISFAQRWTANEGDGWTWILGALGGWLTGAGQPVSRREAMDGIRLLGGRTGELHLALAGCSGADFEPVLLDEGACAVMKSHALDNLARTLEALREATGLDERSAALAAAALSREPALRDRLAGMDALAGTVAIRVHGDYHLGQVLRTPEHDWVILDFEGEPARPASERRQRQPALKDVGGMLRSFAYARGAALDAVASRGAVLPPDTLDSWEADARRAFIEAYRAAARRGGVSIVPPGDRAFARALDAWELDKALYEVRYELANRPGWAALPLAALAAPPAR